MIRARRTRRQADLDRQLRSLRREWRDWVSGRAFATALWYGAPWCDHRQPQSGCEGCGTRAYCRDRAAEVAARAETLRLEMVGPVQGELLVLTSRGWVTA